MTVATRETSYRVVGSEYGGMHDHSAKGATCYGSEGDVCAAPGCGTVLSRYHNRDRCHRCGGGEMRPKRRRGTASACGEATSKAAPVPRRVTQEEIRMAAEQRQEMSESKQRVLAALTDEFETASRIAMRAEVKVSLAYYHLKRLVENGHAEHNTERDGGYRARQDAVAKAAAAACDIPVDNNGGKVTPEPDAASSEVEKSAKDAPEAPAGAAPDSTPEQPAPAAPDPPETQQEPQEEGKASGGIYLGPPPFGGGVDPREFVRPTWSQTGVIARLGSRMIEPSDPEVRVLDSLSRMTPEQRDRTLQFAVAKWWPFADERGA